MKTTLSRRHVLGLGIAGSAAGAAWAADSYPVRDTAFVSNDPSFADLFVDAPKPPGAPNVPGPLIDRIASGFRWAEARCGTRTRSCSSIRAGLQLTVQCFPQPRSMWDLPTELVLECANTFMY